MSESVKLSKPPSHVKPAPDQPIIYANLCEVSVTSEEVILDFGLRVKEDDGSPIGQGLVTIYTNLPHAKRLAQVLTDMIKNYEEMLGEIVEDPTRKLSPEMRQKLEASKE